ncbi:MAG: glycosyltransferase family 4 protein [Coriobacteriia bacterium]
MVCLSGHPGGAEHHVLDLACSLPTRFEVVVVTTAGGWLETECLNAGLETRSIQVPRGNFDLRVLHSLRLLLKSAPPDLLHSHLGRSDWYCWLATLWTRHPRLISTEHGISADTPELFGGAIRRALHRVGHSARLRRTAATIAVSEYTAEALAGRYSRLRRSGVAVVRPGIRTEEYLCARIRRPQTPGRLRVLSAGRLSTEKGMDVGIRAVALAIDRGADIELALAGDGPERASLASLIDSLGLSSRVTMLGHVESMPAVLARADTFMLASRSENLPLAILESLAAGLPVIATDVGGVREAVVHGVTGLLVAPDDVDALAFQLVRLCTEPSLLAELSTGAVDASRHTDVTEMAASVADVYERVLDD